MSNSVVGGIYAQIIDRIIEAAKNDFEEGGYDQSTLYDLKECWQKNLSNLRVAQCPWDPPPTAQPQPPIVNPPTLPSNVTKTEASPLTQPSALPHPAQNGENPGQPYIKQEMKYEPGLNNYPPVNSYGPPGMNPMAQQRASQILQQRFGPDAIPSIQAAGLHQQPPRAPIPGGQRPHMQMPNQGQPRPMPPYPPQQQGSVGAAQTDGAGDDTNEWSDHLTFSRAAGEEGRVWVDGLLRAHLEEQIARTDSGLMVPLAEQPHLKNKKRKLLRQHMAELSVAESSTAVTATAHIVPQFDGGDEDEDEDKEEVKAKVKADEDEDAINSDLDDDDEEDRNDNNDNGEGPVLETILCTYDNNKVKRVKNKWKCTLNDGILTTGGKEYVFHKANGEFEW